MALKNVIILEFIVIAIDLAGAIYYLCVGNISKALMDCTFVVLISILTVLLIKQYKQLR